MPARPRGLLEPCAATSGKHGSEEGGAGKRHPLSDNRVHWPRDVVFGEDRQGAYIGQGPHMMALLRNLVLGLFRMAGISQVKRLTESIAADRMRILPVLAAALKR